MSRRLGPALVVAAILLAAPYGHADSRRSPAFVRPTDARVVVFPPNVAVYEIGAGGQSMLRQDWTETSRNHIANQLEVMNREKVTLVRYKAPEVAERLAGHVQVAKVHALVAQTILRHEYGGESLRLPSMAGRFEWSVGPGAAVIREDSGEADYALFVEFVEGHTSGGRQAMNVAAMVLGGPIVTGMQTGVASLVDLRTGDIVWFHRQSEKGGDLRKLEEAQKAVVRLLRELPF